MENPSKSGEPDRAQGRVTRLIRDIQEGDPTAAANLLPLVYEQLRAIARQRMREERQDHTLQATALVHEAYARLVGNDEIAWDGRGHFFVAAAEAMRRILIEHARSTARPKRGGAKRRRLTLAIDDLADLTRPEKTEEILALEDALCRLQEQQPRVVQVVQLRFYAGLSVTETARVVGISPRTVDFDWAFARAWLYRELANDSGSADQPDGR